MQNEKRQSAAVHSALRTPHSALRTPHLAVLDHRKHDLRAEAAMAFCNNARFADDYPAAHASAKYRCPQPCPSPLGTNNATTSRSPPLDQHRGQHLALPGLRYTLRLPHSDRQGRSHGASTGQGVAANRGRGRQAPSRGLCPAKRGVLGLLGRGGRDDRNLPSFLFFEPAQAGD